MLYHNLIFKLFASTSTLFIKHLIFRNNIVSKIWKIRGLLDKAVQKQDKELAEKAQEKFNKIYETEEYHNSFAIATVNANYENVANRSR